MRRALALALVVACGAPPASAPHNAVGPAPPPPPPSPTAPWLAQLDDPRAQDRALDELARLGDPSAIAPIGEAWLRDGRPLRMLEVMIGLAQPRAWDRALPYLARAVRELDADDPRSVDAAIKAADALGEARLGLDALAEAAQRASDKRTISAQIAAIRALGQLAGDPAHAVVPLVALLGRDAPPHPRTATDAAQRRTFELDYELYLASSGAAINAIASLRTSLAIEPLVLGLYRTPELFAQLRRALIASGPAAERALAATVRGDNAAVEQLFRDRHLDTYCGDRGDAPAGSCQRVSAKLFYASAVLGDFRDPASVHDLVGVLAQPDYPAYYDDDQPSEVTARHAALDALRRIGAPEAA
ncbi:MAG TPA: hypothetical protein VLX92_13960, partial [Kofleriaceae bacterium]|nr:hypothetical protein [Kofleriaceae bacterium]